MRKKQTIPLSLLPYFRKWLVKNGWNGRKHGNDYLIAWKAKHKQIEIVNLKMNKPCLPVFKIFLNGYFDGGKRFLEELA